MTLLLGLVVLDTGIAQAATPPYEPDPNTQGACQPNSATFCTLHLYDANGTPVTSGLTTDFPFAKYAMADQQDLAIGDTKATLQLATPVFGANPGTWTGFEAVSPSTAYPNAAAPAPLNNTGTTGSGFPMVTLGTTSGNKSIATYIGDFPNTDTSDADAGLYQIRMITTGGGGGVNYWSADIHVSGTAWTLVYPPPIAASAPTFIADTPTATAQGGTAYSYTFKATGNPNVMTYAVASGAVPTGLSLNTSTGVLSGTPTTPGTYNFTISATNTTGTTPTPPLSIVVSSLPTPPTFTADSPTATAVVGTPYTYTFTASGSPAPTFTVSSGALPAGLTLNSGTGVLSGTPTVTGNTTFTVTAGNGVPPDATSPTLHINVLQAPAFTAKTPTATASTGVAYNYTFMASGVPAPTFTVSSGSLPTGLALNSSTGVLSGTPTVPGAYTFHVTAANAAGTTDSGAITITITAPPAFINDTPTATALAGTPYSYTFTASGSPAPTFTVSSGSLPAGLTLSSAGVLSGTPTTPGTATFTVTAGNGIPPAAVTGPLSITVQPSPPHFVNDSPPPIGLVGTAYMYTFTASGIPSPTFTVSSGSLPAGLTLNSATGVLSGTPTTNGVSTFQLTAANGAVPDALSASHTITVGTPPAFTADTPPTTGTVGAAYGPYTFTASGSTPVTFTLASGSLPAGLSLNAATGVLNGTPTAGGVSAFTVSAANGFGSPALSPTIVITVSAAPHFTAASPPATAQVGTPYSYTFMATGVPAPVFGVASGSLPAGLSLNAATGVLSGTPTTAGTSSFTVAAANGVAPNAVSPLETITVSKANSGVGYWFAAADGGIFAFGGPSTGFFGSMGSQHLNSPIVGMAAAPDGKGYWLVAADGGMFAFGSAHFFGSMGSQHLNSPIVGMAASPDGQGYWLVAADGGMFAFGSAHFFGSMGSQHLNSPVVGMAAAPDGKGYWLVAADGGMFAFGSAHFFGSMGSQHLNSPIVGMAASPDGQGYWLVAADGGMFAFGSAHFFGSMGSQHLNKPIVGMAPSPDGKGYWLVASDGGVFSFGVSFFGSMGGQHLNSPIVAMAAH